MVAPKVEPRLGGGGALDGTLEPSGTEGLGAGGRPDGRTINSVSDTLFPRLN